MSQLLKISRTPPTKALRDALPEHNPSMVGCVPELQNGSKDKGYLHRLALILSEHCNIACPYCYEHREPEVFYNPEPSMRGMTPESALSILSSAYKLWPKIGVLFFFGGEPLLKKHVIKRICQAVVDHQIEGMETLPRFAMITNGTLLDEDACQMVTHYDFDLNISLDGPPVVNDMTRVDGAGNGTSNTTLKNLRRLREMGRAYHIEATVSRYHLEKGVPATELMDYFYDEHGVTVLHAPWVSAGPSDPYGLNHDEIFAYYEPAIRYSMANIRKGIPKTIFLVDHWLRALPNYQPGAMRTYCPACFSDISVNPAGDIYPCFMFNGYQNLKLGNAYDSRFEEHLNWNTIKAFYATIYGACDCPPEFQFFHSGCVGADRIATNSIMSKPYCGVHTRLLEVFFEELQHDRVGTHKLKGEIHG